MAYFPYDTVFPYSAFTQSLLIIYRGTSLFAQAFMRVTFLIHNNYVHPYKRFSGQKSTSHKENPVFLYRTVPLCLWCLVSVLWTYGYRPYRWCPNSLFIVTNRGCLLLTATPTKTYSLTTLFSACIRRIPSVYFISLRTLLHLHGGRVICSNIRCMLAFFLNLIRLVIIKLSYYFIIQCSLSNIIIQFNLTFRFTNHVSFVACTKLMLQGKGKVTPQVSSFLVSEFRCTFWLPLHFLYVP